MAGKGFHTEIARPDSVESTSGLFKVVIPSTLVVLLLAFFPVYYKMNGLTPPVMLSNSFMFLLMLLIPFIFFYNWYHNNHEEAGELNLTDHGIDFELDGVDRKWHFNLKDVSDLAVIYDGYGGLLSPKKGDGNQLKFMAGGESYSLNFVLKNQDAAEKMGAILKKWYDKGVNIEERTTEGDERYLMLYHAKHRPAVA